jgi:hypothetical protein
MRTMRDLISDRDAADTGKIVEKSLHGTIDARFPVSFH